MSGPPAGTTSIGWATFIPRSFPEGKCSCGTRVSSAAPGGDYPEKQLMEWARRLCRWEPRLSGIRLPQMTLEGMQSEMREAYAPSWESSRTPSSGSVLGWQGLRGVKATSSGSGYSRR
jgi:hypothetical protein